MQPVYSRPENIARAVDLRERGKIYSALFLFHDALVECLDTGNLLGLVDTYAERSLCWKHEWQNTRNRKYIKEMQADVERGMQVELPDSQKPQIFLRRGDVEMLEGNAQGAGEFYRYALRLVCGSRDEAEYVGHLAQHLTETGQLDEAGKLFQKVLGLLYSWIDEYDYKHYLIVRSGLLARMVGYELAVRNYRAAFDNFRRGYELARILAKRYNYPQRRRQYHQAIWDKLLRRR